MSEEQMNLDSRVDKGIADSRVVSTSDELHVEFEWPPEESATSPGTFLRPYEVDKIIIDTDGVRKLSILNAYPHLSLSAFMERVADHLRSTISVYSTADDNNDFIRIYTTNEEDHRDGRYEKVQRGEALVMDSLLEEAPGMYVGNFADATVRRGGESYVGVHLTPQLQRRRSVDDNTSEAHILLNVMAKEETILSSSDLQFLRLLVPMISKDIQWTQLIALKDRDEQGFIRDRDQFYEIVKGRIRRTGRDGKRSGIIVTDLVDFGEFNKLASEEIGDAVIEAMRSGTRRVIRAGDIASIKQYQFQAMPNGGIEIRQSEETAQGVGDESIFAASARSLGDLVMMGGRLADVVDNIDVYELFRAEEARNSDFDAESSYNSLLEKSPHMVRDGKYHLRLSVGVTLLQPPTDKELADDALLSEYARRAGFQTDRAMQDVKRRDKAGDGIAVGYTILEPDPGKKCSIYRPGFIDMEQVEAIRSTYALIAKEPDEEKQTAMRRRADEATESLLYDNLITSRTRELSSTTRFPMSVMRSASYDAR